MTDIVFEYVHNGEQARLRDDENDAAWIATDTTGEDLLYERGQFENDGIQL